MSGRKPLDLEQQRFGRLVAIKNLGRSPRGYDGHLWECICDCGKTTTGTARTLRSGNKTSCGCRKVECMRELGLKQFEHGHSCENSRTYIAWQAMRRRCLKKDTYIYLRYGARGITFCDAWKSFSRFLEDMGEAPAGRTLGRIDNDRGYSKDNCRWETPKEQARNRRTSRHIEYKGRIVTMAELVELTGLTRTVLDYWLKKSTTPNMWADATGTAV